MAVHPGRSLGSCATARSTFDADVVINGEEDNPAALIQVYRETDGEWASTDVYVGHRFSTLRKIKPLRMMEVKEVVQEESVQRDLEGKQFKRVEATRFKMLDERTMEFPFSSNIRFLVTTEMRS